jgi:hypothetical protein
MSLIVPSNATFFTITLDDGTARDRLLDAAAADDDAAAAFTAAGAFEARDDSFTSSLWPSITRPCNVRIAASASRAYLQKERIKSERE